MITHEEQLKLFSEIADKLQKPVSCYAFGGTAMVFYDIKSETKDIDLLFLTQEDRIVFIEALKENNFTISSPFRVYIQRKENDARAPVMYRRYETRIDLFAQTVFRSQLSPLMQEDITQVHEFGSKRQLKMSVMNTEHIVYLKGITERKRDFEDILLITTKDKHFSWEKVIDEAVWQHEHGDDWALVDTEKTLQQMKAYMPIDKKHLERLYEKQR